MGLGIEAGGFMPSRWGDLCTSPRPSGARRAWQALHDQLKAVKMERMVLNEKRVHRQVALPVSAFDVLQALKRKWDLETNGEVLTRLLLTAGPTLLQNDENTNRVQQNDRRRA